jgi:hypothetical protein
LSVALREEQRLRMFENMVLREITGPKWEEMTGGWGKLHNEELHNVYPSPNRPIIRLMKSWRIRWAVYIARIWIKIHLHL